MADPVKYDDVDWHVDAALAAGQPEERAATHIGLYLSWLIRHDMHDTQFFTDEWIDAIKRGEMMGSELMDAIDQKLVSAWMTPEGAAFTDWYYAAGYAADFARAFSDVPDYGLADTAAAGDRLHPVIDRAYADWIKKGRPLADARAEPAAVPGDRQGVLFMASPGSWDDFQMPDEVRQAVQAEIAQALARGVKVEYYDAPPLPHEFEELERLIPRDFTAPPLTIHSISATNGGSSMLSRALKRLGVKPSDAAVAIGQGGQGDATVTVTIYAIPGVDSAALWAEVPMLVKQPGMKCVERAVGAKRVLWCDRPEFRLATWARDELLVSASALDDATLESLVAQLP